MRQGHYRIANNEGLMQLRQRRPQVVLDAIAEILPADAMPPPPQAWMHDPESTALNGELRDQLIQAIITLPPSLRVVVVLRDIAELSTEATAVHLGITPGAVKVRLHRARLRLRRLLADYVEVPGES